MLSKCKRVVLSHREEKSSDERSTVRGQTDWGVTYSSHQICASKGSTVDIPCTYTYPPRIDELDTKVEETLWFTNLNGNQSVDLRSDPDYSDRVEYLYKQNDCTLRIKDLRETDSAEYKFRFTTNQREDGVTGSPGVTLTVTDAPKPPSVSQSPSGEVIEGRAVTLTCSSDAYPTARYTWYKVNGNELRQTGWISEKQFRSIQPSDSGEYYCLAENKLGKSQSELVSIKVKYAPTICSVSVNPLGEIRENSRVTLTCSCDGYPTPVYTWYKWKSDEQPRKGSELVFRSIQSSDSGEYYCSAKNDLGNAPKPPSVSVSPSDPQKPPSVSVSPSGEIVEGSSVTLTCSSDTNPAANYTWYKKNEDSPKASGEIFTIENTGAEHSGDYVCVAQNEKGHHNSTVHVTVVEDTAEPEEELNYESEAAKGCLLPNVHIFCRDHISSLLLTGMRRAEMNAAAKEIVFFLLAVSAVRGQTDWGVTYSSHQICASKGSTVDIPCTFTYPPRIDELDTKVEETLWVTNLNGNQSVDLRSDPDYSGRVEYLFKQNDCTLRIKDLRETDSAEYKFRFTTNQTGDGVTGSLGVTLTVTGLRVVVESVSTEADLRCENSCKASDYPSYVWYKDEEEMNEQTFFLRVSDFGKSYSCALKNHEDQRSAAVYAPKTPSVSVSPSGEVKEGRAVTLTCSSDANPAARYTWYKVNGNEVRQVGWISEKYFSFIQPSDSGEYYCTAWNRMGKSQSEVISIKVKYAPKFCSMSVNPLGEIRENSSVTLTCSSDSYPTPVFTWYKMKSSGYHSKGSELVFSSIQSSDSGEYFCSAQNGVGVERMSRSTYIDVKYPPKPPSVSVSPSGEIVEGSSVTLTCSSDANPAANIMWNKKNGTRGHQIGNRNTKYFRSIQPSDSGEYYCTAENGLGNQTSELIVIDVTYAPQMSRVSMNPPGTSTLQIHLVRLTLMLLMMTPLLLLTLWMRKKKTGSSTTEPNEPVEPEDTEEQEDMV
ncbi:B-cell receptor CD22-like [Halichoeres trimaculatus]|uniref:B-cell receptor CD22-like n=1 Tax=Halichoeres trimaculatus TaxID=147232 RepID=UPI003D9DEC95